MAVQEHKLNAVPDELPRDDREVFRVFIDRYRVSLPDHPMVEIDAPTRSAAVAEYKQMHGIISTVHHVVCVRLRK